MPGPEGGQAEIVLAEGMAPLANAMGLVHSNGPNGHGPAGRLEGRLSEPFGGNEEKPTRTVLEAGQGALDLFGVKARGDGHRCDAGLFQSFHLIGHQGDQGADDETDPAPVQSGDLIADGLATAGGEDRQDIPPGGRLHHHWFLGRPEGRMSPMLMKQRLEIGQGRTRSGAWWHCGSDHHGCAKGTGYLAGRITRSTPYKPPKHARSWQLEEQQVIQRSPGICTRFLPAPWRPERRGGDDRPTGPLSGGDGSRSAALPPGVTECLGHRSGCPDRGIHGGDVGWMRCAGCDRRPQ